MTWRLWLKPYFVCLTLAVSLIARTTFAATPAEIDQAIQFGVKTLYDQQRDDNWEGIKKGDPPSKNVNTTGQSALAVYALLSAGESQSDPKLAAAVEWLKSHETQGTYALGLRAQVWNMIPHDREDVKALIRKEAALLTPRWKDPNLAKINPFRGLYGYNVNDDAPTDNSCSQYGVLGAWALEQAGANISYNYWKAVETAWMANQSPANGGWQYLGAGNESTLNMTAAGVATLFITQEYLRLNEGIRCTGTADYRGIDRGMAWFHHNFPRILGKQPIDLYGMYGIERIGVASGYKYLGTINWYDALADEILRSRKDAGWDYREWSIGTSYALLVLTRGRYPVAINKLQYTNTPPANAPATRPTNSDTASWNQRPRDVANLTRFMGKQIERELNWQIVDFNNISEDFHDAPLLYISGNQALNLTGREEARLKQFVEEGGLILGHADCANQQFAESFKALGTKLFSSAGNFRPIEDDHPIYTRQQFMRKNWKTNPDLLGLSNGVRELMLLIPTADTGKLWQQNDPKTNPEQFQLMSDIFLYSIDSRNFRLKGTTYMVYRDPRVVAVQNASIARLNVGANPDPEPGGWRRMANVLHNDYQLDLDVRTVDVDPAKLASFRVAHLTGTGNFQLTDPQRQAIQQFVLGGGTLIIDSAGGNTAFADAAAAELQVIFPAQAGQLNAAIPSNHPLFSVRGTSIPRVNFRPFSIGIVPRSQRTPLLRGITINQRLAVIFSREDLSAGMVGQPVDGIFGYDTESATELMRNILLFAVGELPKPPPPPPKQLPDAGGLLGGLLPATTQPDQAPEP